MKHSKQKMQQQKVVSVSFNLPFASLRCLQYFAQFQKKNQRIANTNISSFSSSLQLSLFLHGNLSLYWPDIDCGHCRLQGTVTQDQAKDNIVQIWRQKIFLVLCQIIRKINKKSSSGPHHNNKAFSQVVSYCFILFDWI